MPLNLDEVIIWSRSFEEYANFLALTPSDLGKKILAIADGASSFNLEARNKGSAVVSVDPLYQFSAEEIEMQIQKSCDVVYPQILNNKEDYHWNLFKSPAELKEHRLQVMVNFLEDYKMPRAHERYICGALPHLPIQSKSFDLALVSHFLFLYAGQFDLAFHIAALEELLRIADEVRVFPLRGNLSHSFDYLNRVTHYFTVMGCEVQIQEVDYHLTKGSNKMLRLQKRGVK